MNNDDLRKVIWSYLRKPELKCYLCNKKLIFSDIPSFINISIWSDKEMKEIQRKYCIKCFMKVPMSCIIN